MNDVELVIHKKKKKLRNIFYIYIHNEDKDFMGNGNICMQSLYVHADVIAECISNFE